MHSASKLTLQKIVLSDNSSMITDGDWIESKDQDANGEVRLIQLADIGDGVFKDVSRRFLTKETAKRLNCTFLEPGDILVARMPDPIGRCAIFPGLDRPAVTAVDVCIVRTGHNTDRNWLMQTLNSPTIRSQVLALAGGGTRQRVSTKELKGLRLRHPCLTEQRKIAEILRTWDEAIENLSILRQAKKRRFIGLRQRLFGDRGQYIGHWHFQPLAEITTRVRRRNDGGDHPVMTISAKSGFLLQSDKFARDMAGSSAERYTLLHEGEFAYNKGNSLTAPYGCIYELERPTAVVPFVYFSFALRSGLDRAFYRHLFASGYLNHQLSRLINSGVRNDGLLNLDVDDFFSCKVPVPPLDEQRQIGRVLTAAKDELDLLDREIAALKRQKRGLMQKLLTGEWRVPTEDQG